MQPEWVTSTERTQWYHVNMKRHVLTLWFLTAAATALLGVLVGGCQSQDKELDVPTNGMTLTSSAFSHESAIPTTYSCDGQDISPPLQWSGAPEDTTSFVLIADDPDAPGGTFVHWVYFNIPADAEGLPADVPNSEEPPTGGRQGTSSFRKVGYGGPCPPGGTHRYFFTLYAVDTMLDLDSGATKEDVLTAAEGHALAKAQLMGTFAR